MRRTELEFRYDADIKNAASLGLRLSFYDTEDGEDGYLAAQVDGWRPCLFQGPAWALGWFFAGWNTAEEARAKEEA